MSATERDVMQEFDRLSAALPLLLLPIRLETRFVMSTDPAELQIRIYPDQIHIDGDRAPARAVLLPRRWIALGYSNGFLLFRTTSGPVARNLRTGPDPESPAWTVSDGVEIDDGLAWMVDYGRALEAGMAISVPLVGDAEQLSNDELDVLLVLGIDAEVGADDAAAELTRVLDVHGRTAGFGFVPQGTPTNNTPAAASGWTPHDVETAGAAERARQGPLLTRPDNAAEFAEALGLTNANALRSFAHATREESIESRHMRVVTYEAVFGTLLRQLLDVGNLSALSSNVMNEIRDWFVDHVTGGSHVPTVRIGAQPYGILPVRRSIATLNLETTAGQVERVVRLLQGVWTASADELPSLDSDLADVPPEGELPMESVLATILALQPHPARLFLRTVQKLEEDEGVFLFSLQWHYRAIEFRMAQAMKPESYEEGVSQASIHYADLLARTYPAGLQRIDEQINLWNMVKSELSNQSGGETVEKGHAFADSVLALLEQYELRQRPLRWLWLDHYSGVLGDETNTTLVAASLSGALTEWGELGVIEAPDAGAGATAAAYLADFEQRFQERSPTALPASELSRSISPKPLLYQLLNRTLPLVPEASASAVPAALSGLAALAPEQLEWLFRETLGLGAHRLDAWATSLAAERLDQLRKTQRTGIQIGAFGWVVALKRRRDRRPSEGFVHAPSLAHATTAALLRAGWHAHGTDDPNSPVAVDLRSDRVRTASWLLDGVRRDQPLGELLGHHFERFLHDHGADAEISPVRQLVLASQERPHAVPDRPVDGIELLELWRKEGLEDVAPWVRRALEDLERAFDAVNDVTLFEAVHQLAAGNHARATAVLDAASSGSVGPPELRAPRTPRSALAVEHRVVILLDPDAKGPERGWTAGVRDTLAPALEAWIAQLLPEAHEVGFSVAPAASRGAPVRLTLKQLGLSALDAVHLVGDDPASVSPSLRTLACAAAGLEAPVTIDPCAQAGTRVTLSDFGVLAIELRRLLETLRPADARDLRPAAVSGEPDVDRAAAVNAVAGLIAEARRLRATLDQSSPQALAAALRRLALFGIGDEGAPSDAALVVEVRQILDRRLESVRQAAGAQPRANLDAQLAALLGQRIPLLGRFEIAAAQGGTVVDLGEGAAMPVIDDWLDAVARVRRDVGNLCTSGMLSELLGAAGLALAAGQTPRDSGEGWAAVKRPAGPGRLSVVAVCGPGGPRRPGQAACGLVVDQWSEGVPADEQVSGVTFQFDAPSNRPPQAWLLAVAPEGESWSFQLVVDTLLETLEWARVRGVGPEDVIDYGRAIPTSFAPGTLEPWPKEALA